MVAPQPHPRYAPLSDGTALDLGSFRCVDVPGEQTGNCRRVTDDSALRYDPARHVFWLIGGGSTGNDSLYSFDPQTAKWTAAYEATTCAERAASNLDTTNHTWRTGAGPYWPRPVIGGAHDLLVFAPNVNELVYLTRGTIYPNDTCSSVELQGDQGPIAHWSPDAGWTFAADALVDGEPEYRSAYQAWEYDPPSERIWGVGQAGLYEYDPRARTKRRWLAMLDPNDTGFNNELVSTLDGGLFYFDRFRSGVFRVELDRASPFQSTSTRVASTGGFPSRTAGYTFDSKRGRIVGPVENGKIWVFDPTSSTFSSLTPLEVDGGVADVGTMNAHAIAYDPVDDVVVFVTILESGYRTWAYRPLD